MSEVHHHSTPVDVEEHFEFTSGARNKALAAIGIGLLLLVAGVFLLMGSSGQEGHEVAHGAAQAGHDAASAGNHEPFHWTQRLWANLWLNNVWFTGISLIGLFFVAFNYVSYAGWSAVIQRIPLAMASLLPVTGVLMVIYFVLGHHDIFHWTHPELTEVGNAHYDSILAGKKPYLNTPFFIIRMVIYFVLWILMLYLIRKQSFQEDIEGGTAFWHKNTIHSATFLVIFGVSSSMAAWDWVMSIDPHWFSTLFGWYTFASWFVSGLATITLVLVLLKEAGYLRVMNQSHLHDMGKYMFAFSIFWSYLWIAQFLLIYYANLPEEAVYFWDRFNGYGGMYKPIFFINVGLNFFFPFLVLMTREAKRHRIFLKIVCVAVLSGHWIDFYLMMMPGIVKGNGGFGLVEIGTALAYIGLFALVVGTALTKASLIPKNHPMLEESIYHNL